uniref:Leucine rich repeat containing 75A n=1 Tax=Anas zonorhyncha TaxID=75864 RepID=A0A8B9ZU75_9AVES
IQSPAAEPPPLPQPVCSSTSPSPQFVLATGFSSTSNTAPLPCLLQDLGMESTSLDDVLYRYASFRNLVDPITHDLIISLARYIHCPKPGDSLGAMEKLCRQLTYHLSPHSQWRRQGIMKRNLKAVLMGKPQDNTVDLSGIPLTLKDLERIASYLQHSSEHIDTVELCFTELTDEMLLQLLPALCVLPHLTTLSLNGNRLTKAILRDLTETLKDPKKFPSVTWIDLGNNVDIFSLPQPFLVSLKRRCPKQGNLPTILEFGEGGGVPATSPMGGLCLPDAGTELDPVPGCCPLQPYQSWAGPAACPGFIRL